MSRPSGKRSRLTITNPLSPFASRTNREYHINRILQPWAGLTYVVVPSSPQPSSPVCSLNPHLQCYGFKPSTFCCHIVSCCLVLIRHSPWSYYLPMFGVFINLGLLYWKRHAHPLNLVLLSTFTLLEAFTLGILCAYFDNTIVIQALYVIISSPPVSTYGTLTSSNRLITLGVFLGLTVFTFQSKVCKRLHHPHPLLTPSSMTFLVWDPGCSAASSLSASVFSTSLIPPFSLTSHRIAAGMTGIVGIFLPFSRTIDLLYAIGGTIIFSGYIVYDTYLINARLSPDEYIMAAISLYLECVPVPLLALESLTSLSLAV